MVRPPSPLPLPKILRFLIFFKLKNEFKNLQFKYFYNHPLYASLNLVLIAVYSQQNNVQTHLVKYLRKENVNKQFW